MKNINPTKIGENILLLLYTEVLLRFEKDLTHHKSFDIRSKGFRQTQKQIDLTIRAKDKKSELLQEISNLSFIKGESPKNIFIFVRNKKESRAKSLFRHLRNSVAHGIYEKKKIGKYEYLLFEDFHQKKLTMIGQIRLLDLNLFIEALSATRK